VFFHNLFSAFWRGSQPQIFRLSLHQPSISIFGATICPLFPFFLPKQRMSVFWGAQVFSPPLWPLCGYSPPYGVPPSFFFCSCVLKVATSCPPVASGPQLFSFLTWSTPRSCCLVFFFPINDMVQTNSLLYPTHLGCFFPITFSPLLISALFSIPPVAMNLGVCSFWHCPPHTSYTSPQFFPRVGPPFHTCQKI